MTIFSRLSLYFATLFLFFTSPLFALEVQKPKIYQDQNISHWLMSEKLDGIRGYWSGDAMYTKNGNKIAIPNWFITNFPPFELDGELWSKRDDFEFIQSTVLDSNATLDWEKLTYNIFEVPNSDGNFTARLNRANQWFQTHPNKYVKIIEQFHCDSEENLNSFLDAIIVKKGEGVIVKDPSKPYHTGRSDFVLKVKKSFDMEGTITGYNYQSNGHTIKSFQIQLENGVQFNLGNGLDQNMKKSPPPLGSVVTFKYYGFTKNGKPKFANFLRLRKQE
ncbi:MAG: DNA ligase [Campylobacterales bacterium]|nr:DNA ligase [Campylobacterales bacterium]